MYLLIRFKTDDTINWKGFSAAYVLAAPDAQAVTPSIAARRYDSDHVPLPKPRKSKHKYTHSVHTGGGKIDRGAFPIDEEAWDCMKVCEMKKCTVDFIKDQPAYLHVTYVVVLYLIVISVMSWMGHIRSYIKYYPGDTAAAVRKGFIRLYAMYFMEQCKDAMWCCHNTANFV